MRLSQSASPKCKLQYIQYIVIYSYCVLVHCAAMRGFSFFGAAFRAQELVLKNKCRAGALECLSDLLVFLAKIAVSALTFVVAFCLLAVCCGCRSSLLATHISHYIRARVPTESRLTNEYFPRCAA